MKRNQVGFKIFLWLARPNRCRIFLSVGWKCQILMNYISLGEDVQVTTYQFKISKNTFSFTFPPKYISKMREYVFFTALPKQK